MKVIYKSHVDEKAKKTFLNYYLELDNGNQIPIKPSFKEDYPKLRVLAEKRD